MSTTENHIPGFRQQERANGQLEDFMTMNLTWNIRLALLQSMLPPLGTARGDEEVVVARRAKLLLLPTLRVLCDGVDDTGGMVTKLLLPLLV